MYLTWNIRQCIHHNRTIEASHDERERCFYESAKNKFGWNQKKKLLYLFVYETATNKVPCYRCFILFPSFLCGWVKHHHWLHLELCRLLWHLLNSCMKPMFQCLIHIGNHFTTFIFKNIFGQSFHLGSRNWYKTRWLYCIWAKRLLVCGISFSWEHLWVCGFSVFTVLYCSVCFHLKGREFIMNFHILWRANIFPFFIPLFFFQLKETRTFLIREGITKNFGLIWPRFHTEKQWQRLNSGYIRTRATIDLKMKQLRLASIRSSRNTQIGINFILIIYPSKQRLNFTLEAIDKLYDSQYALLGWREILSQVEVHWKVRLRSCWDGSTLKSSQSFRGLKFASQHPYQAVHNHL